MIADLDKLGRSPLCSEYLAWADACESRLRAVFAEPDITARLHTSRYVYLYRHDEADDRWVNTNLPVPDPAGQEAAAQVAYLKSVAEQVRQLEALSGRPGRVHVYDTNSLMHYQPPEAIDWPAVAKGRVVRLVVPLVVVDELDRKQHEGSKEMAQRARRALRALDGVLDGTQPGAAASVPGRPGVSIEILLDEAGHRREAGADDEIIERSVLLAQITGGPATVVTADTGMRLRAQAAGLHAVRLPEKYRKDQE
ncbi:PIN domain-containing protein [Streptomyces europaeiscabiei]|uniref:PIN domain-containing protein n=1 Tax=Streptomyces europaeiscabiei TaxID=146819 RepID=UPI002E0DC840|nr:PIN domain-containing protein [Streptomyces europaeiscabiei]